MEILLPLFGIQFPDTYTRIIIASEGGNEATLRNELTKFGLRIYVSNFVLRIPTANTYEEDTKPQCYIPVAVIKISFFCREW